MRISVFLPLLVYVSLQTCVLHYILYIIIHDYTADCTTSMNKDYDDSNSGLSVGAG